MRHRSQSGSRREVSKGPVSNSRGKSPPKIKTTVVETESFHYKDYIKVKYDTLLSISPYTLFIARNEALVVDATECFKCEVCWGIIHFFDPNFFLYFSLV